MGIEPASLTAVSCRNAADRAAASWREQLAPFKALEFAASDAAKGIASGLDRLARRRHQADDPTPLIQGLDLFHTAREVRTVPTRAWPKAEAVWAKAEAADARVAASKRQGGDARGPSKAAVAAWRRAVAALEDVERQESAWRPARAGLDLFDAEGRLNDRARATTEIAGALKGLDGPEWKTIRNFLSDARTTAFLGRMHRRLAEAEPRADWRGAMAWRWWGRHRRPSDRPDARVDPVRAVAWGRPLGRAERDSYDRVSVVLGSTVRASSAVESMNGVLRGQQSNHKRLTQAMLELKRLYWDCHRLKSGKRKGRLPVRAPGPEELRLLEFAPGRSRPADARTVRSKRCPVRQSPMAGVGLRVYAALSHSAGDRYPGDECRRMRS